jgi:hypothetical protein
MICASKLRSVNAGGANAAVRSVLLTSVTFARIRLRDLAQGSGTARGRIKMQRGSKKIGVDGIVT